MACGLNDAGQLGVPALVVDLIYTRVAAGGGQATLLQSAGTPVACGLNDEGQGGLPAPVVDFSTRKLLLVGATRDWSRERAPPWPAA